MSIVPIARHLAKRYIVPAAYVDFARRYTNRIFSDYVSDSGGRPSIQSNTRPQMPFQLGSLKRKRTDSHGSSKVHIGGDSGVGKFSVKKKYNTSSKSNGMYEGRIAKPTKKFKKSKAVTLQKKDGVNHTIEMNSVAQGTDTAWIGHTAFPLANIYYQAVKIAYKMLLKRAGFEVVSADQDNVLIQNGAVIEVSYKIGPDGLWTAVNYTFTAGTQRTMNHFVSWWNDIVRPWNAIPEVEFRSLQYFSINQQVYVDLKNLLIDFHCKSTMKVQNRSLNQTDVEGDDNIEESDAVVLVGKSYAFNGTELKFKKSWIQNGTSPNIATADYYTGQITASESDNSMKEPPNGYVEFTNCKKVGKLFLNPGSLKKSVVSFGKKMYFQTIHNMLGDVNASAATLNPKKISRTYGKSVLYCLEKMINTSEVHNIRIAYEINCEISASGYVKREFSTVKSFEKV